MDELAAVLRDSGCEAAEIEEIANLYRAGEARLMMKRLRRCRCRMVESLHERQEELDRFDLLLYRLEGRLDLDGTGARRP